MQVKLDWFAFTFPITLLGEKDNEFTLDHILHAFEEHTGQRLLPATQSALWCWVEATGFYSHRIQHPQSLIAISWRAGNPYALCEIPGRSVDVVLQSIPLSSLAQAAGGRTTRLDIAVDFETDVKPEAFAALRDERAFRAYALYTTETGDTVYIGSRKSERMARVYRYNPPHPRAHLLRAEVELKGDAAKIATNALATTLLTEVCLSVHAPFGWKHPLWNPDGIEVSKLPARAYDNEGANTLKWLADTVVPSIRKAHQKGLIDLVEWLNENFPEISR